MVEGYEGVGAKLLVTDVWQAGASPRTPGHLHSLSQEKKMADLRFLDK